jgi:DNA-binding response OmpR family regulator
VDRRNVLIVEDEPEIRGLLMCQMRDNGWTVDGAANGIDGLARLKECQFDVIVSDINMPILSGMSFFNAVRLSGNNVPVVFLTASTDSAHIKEALRLGAFDYIEKPVSNEELINVLKRAIEVSEAERRIRNHAAVEGFKATGTDGSQGDTTVMPILRAKNNLKR